METKSPERKQDPDKAAQHKFHKTTLGQSTNSPILDFTPDKISTFQKALKDKIFLLGKEETDAYGLKADWTHFDFIAAAYSKNFRKAPNDLVLMKIFWSILWEYLGPLLKSYEQLTNHHDQIEKDMSDMLQNHAMLRIKLDYYDEFISKHMPRPIAKNMRDFLAEHQRRLGEKLERIQKDEAFKQQEEERLKADFKEKVKAKAGREASEKLTIVP